MKNSILQALILATVVAGFSANSNAVNSVPAAMSSVCKSRASQAAAPQGCIIKAPEITDVSVCSVAYRCPMKKGAGAGTLGKAARLDIWNTKSADQSLKACVAPLKYDATDDGKLYCLCGKDGFGSPIYCNPRTAEFYYQ